jgi:hypothetical protein
VRSYTVNNPSSEVWKSTASKSLIASYLESLSTLLHRTYPKTAKTADSGKFYSELIHRYFGFSFTYPSVFCTGSIWFCPLVMRL